MGRIGIMTLTTDFGVDGPYVAAMKGIVLGLEPSTQLVDVSHAIGPQDVLEGAFVLSGIVDAFPPGTVHLAVVDPGVGTDRRLIAVAMADQWFVLPDNGLIGGVRAIAPPPGSGRFPTRRTAARRSPPPSTGATCWRPPPSTCCAAATRPNSARPGRRSCASPTSSPAPTAADSSAR